MVDFKVDNVRNLFIGIKEAYFASVVGCDLFDDVLSWVINLDAVKRLAEFSRLTNNTKELDFHGYEISVLAKFIWALSKASWLKHHVPGWSALVKFEGKLGT